MKAAKSSIEYSVLEGASLNDAHPELRRLFMFCAAFIRLRLGRRRIIVTSVKRQGPGVHAHGRGIDFMVEDKDTMEYDNDVIRALLSMKNMVNLLFPYTKGNGTPGHTVVYRMRSGDGSDADHRIHVHIQRPAAGWGTEA